MRLGIFALLPAGMFWSVAGGAQDAGDIERIANTMVRLCVAGGYTEAVSGGGAGGADLSLRSLEVKGNLKGEFKITKSNAEGLVGGIENAMTQIAADQADKMRACLEPVRQRLLDVMLPPKPPPAPGKQSEPSAAVPPYQRRIQIGGFAIGDSFERVKASLVPPGVVSKTKNGKEQVSFRFQYTIPQGIDGAPADTPVRMIGRFEEDGGLIAKISATTSVAGYCRNNFAVDNAMREATKDLGEPIAGRVEPQK
jgi:hypothetical protein